GLQELAAEPIEAVGKAVARGAHDRLAVLAVDLGIDQDVAAGLVIVHRVVGRILVIPAQLAGGGVERQRTVGVEIVARPIGAVGVRRRVSRTPVGGVGRGIIRAGDIEGAATGLPGIVLVLPGLMPRLAGSRNGVEAPELVAGLGVERDQPVAHALV